MDIDRDRSIYITDADGRSQGSGSPLKVLCAPK